MARPRGTRGASKVPGAASTPPRARVGVDSTSIRRRRVGVGGGGGGRRCHTRGHTGPVRIGLGRSRLAGHRPPAARPARESHRGVADPPTPICRRPASDRRRGPPTGWAAARPMSCAGCPASGSGSGWSSRPSAMRSCTASRQIDDAARARHRGAAGDRRRPHRPAPAPLPAGAVGQGPAPARRRPQPPAAGPRGLPGHQRPRPATPCLTILRRHGRPAAAGAARAPPPLRLPRRPPPARSPRCPTRWPTRSSSGRARRVERGVYEATDRPRPDPRTAPPLGRPARRPLAHADGPSPLDPDLDEDPGVVGAAGRRPVIPSARSPSLTSDHGCC